MSEQLFLPAPQKENRSAVRRSRRLIGFGLFGVFIATMILVYGGQQKEWLANLTINDLHLTSSEEIALLQEAQNAVLEKNMTPIEIIVKHQDDNETLHINTSLQEIGFEYSLNEEYFDQSPEDRITPFFAEQNSLHASSVEIAQLNVNQAQWRSFVKNIEKEVRREAKASSLEWSQGQWTLAEAENGRELDTENAERTFQRITTSLQKGAAPQKLNLKTLAVFASSSKEADKAHQDTYERIQAFVSQPVLLHLEDESFEIDLNSEEDFILFQDDEVLINREKLIEILNPIRESFYRETNTIRIVGKEEVRYNAFKAVTEGKFIEGRRVNAYELADQIIAELLRSADEKDLIVAGNDEESSAEHLDVYGKVYEIPLKVYSEIEEMEYDLLSVGYSEYSESLRSKDYNRLHNINTGLDRINGSIIEPGAKISFNRMNGPINGEFKTGYAIFGAQAKPSLGGGICQVSTTFYRSLLNAGTPITMRQNHSWDLSYYRVGGYGLDATIFPSVGLDVKAVNDYESDLFFYAYDRPDTAEAFVLVYGKADGRSVKLEPEEDYEPFYGAKTLKWTQTIEKENGEVIMNDIVSRYRM